MIGFYAIGGGWGHLMRVKTFINNQNIHADFKIITTNLAASQFFHKNNIILIDPIAYESQRNLKNAINKIIANKNFKKLYIDTFPNGILGELTPEMFININLYLLARRLKWDNYEDQIGQPLKFQKTYLFESLEPAHQNFILNHSIAVKPFTLSYKPANSHKLEISAEKLNKPIWLIVHSQNKEEVDLLINHAKDIAKIEKIRPQFIVLTATPVCDTHNVNVLNNEHATDWYPVANRIFTGAGFNTIYELAEYRDKHICLPFHRRYDDQFWRARFALVKA